jgi:hypothetical protein
MVAIHPGRILKRELKARGLSANKLALALRVPSGRITAILKRLFDLDRVRVVPFDDVSYSSNSLHATGRPVVSGWHPARLRMITISARTLSSWSELR